MFKKALLTVLVLLGAISLYAQEEEIPWRQNITMLVVPREPLAIQVAQDISRRYPVLLVCYQSTPAEPVLHAWNGKSWVPVATADYVNGTFFTHRPRHAVIVEAEGQPAPDILIPDGTWCESGNRLTSTDTRVMIHLLGRYFDFPYRYWMQFSKRYGYTLEEINPALINVFWWHYRADEAIAAFKARDFDLDMDKWFFLDITPPEPIEPVVIKAEPETLPPAETPAEEMIEEPTEIPAEAIPMDDEVTVDETIIDVTETAPEVAIEEVAAPVVEINPFSTNDIPAAELIVLPAE
ncbi:MAG: hypothetical protein ISR85_00640 [Kiritimatiellales bacterium]|nr:hypothetical protein [Kiritimatiellota bacterium]MBL7011418.1 hypothetical protein [Kiritimatiellales bacterium]